MRQEDRKTVWAVVINKTVCPESDPCYMPAYNVALFATLDEAKQYCDKSNEDILMICEAYMPVFTEPVKEVEEPKMRGIQSEEIE